MPLPAPDPEAALRRLAGALRRDLATAVAAEPAVDELAAYLEGDLDEVEREILDTRLADDPALRDELAALAGEHQRLAARRAALRTSRFAGARWAALAALLAVAVAGSWLIGRGSERGSLPSHSAALTPTRSAELAVAGPGTAGAELVDGSFESGRIGALEQPESRIDFENGSLAGLTAAR